MGIGLALFVAADGGPSRDAGWMNDAFKLGKEPFRIRLR
jgi:hypothetical protein